MILTHPFLFNSIVVLFIAFTAGWIVFSFTGSSIANLKGRIAELENQREKDQKKIHALEDQLERHSPWLSNRATVIPLSSSAKAWNN